MNKIEEIYQLANNIFWSWDFETKDLFESIDPILWKNVSHNPKKLLNELGGVKLNNLFNDDKFSAKFESVYKKYKNYLEGSNWFKLNYHDEKSLKIAYFSAEFGLTECIRIYSGGLGVLSGDHLKSASDLGIPLVGI